MGDNGNCRNELDFDGISLIDISAEDDSLLLFSSFLDPTSYQFSDTDKEDRGLSLFGDTHNCDEEILDSTLEDKGLQNMMKTDLRKSLAWNKVFFTNSGVLEPDELSSMIENNQMGKRKILPAIQENLQRSTESVSTLKSDCTVENGQDFVLLEDVRQSIQSSAISSDAVTPDKSKELGATEAAASPTTSTLDYLGSQEKKPNPLRKRPSIRAQGLGKSTKQPVTPTEHNTSISRPSNGLTKTIRASVDANRAKQEKILKLTGGKEPLAPRSPVSRRTRPIVSKNELASSCSSLESCLSILSSASNKSSLDSVRQNIDQSLRKASHSLGNRPISRAASKNITQPKVSTLSASRTYKSKLSSRFSSSVDWSSESPRASTPNKTAKGNKETVPGKSAPTTKTLKPFNNVTTVQDDPKVDKQSAKRGSVVNGNAVRSSSMMKPTGLRVPSPKIGYFDGARSSIARTPIGSCTGPVSGLTKNGARSPNESTGSRTNHGKSQFTRFSLTKSTNSIPSPVSRNPRLIVPASPKLTNKMYSKRTKKCLYHKSRKMSGRMKKRLKVSNRIRVVKPDALRIKLKKLFNKNTWNMSPQGQLQRGVNQTQPKPPLNDDEPCQWRHCLFRENNTYESFATKESKPQQLTPLPLSQVN